MRVLVSGAAGFIGSAFVRSAGERHTVYALTRDEPDERADRGDVRWVAADLAARGFSRTLPTDIDAVVHLAQSAHHREFPDRALDLLDVNVGGAAELLDHARAHGARHFVLASTANVYGRSAAPLDEDAEIRCTTHYARTKRAAEMLAESYADLMSVTVLRLFTVYGPGQRRGLVVDLATRVAQGEPVTVEGRAGLVVDPVHVDDVVQVILAVLDAPPDGYDVFNVGANERLSIVDLAEAIGRAVGVEPRFEHVAADDPGGWAAVRHKLDGTFDVPPPRSFAAGFRPP